jgi:hypothetical protein
MDCLNRSLAISSISLFASLLLVAAPGEAEAQGQQRGDGSLRMEYQAIRTGSFISGINEFDYWTTDTQVLLLSGDYALNESWTVFAALPYARKRFNSEVEWGGDPHNPNDPYWTNFVPPDKRFWDDGEYHGDFQDFSIGVSYRFAKGPVIFQPYISYGVPATNYPFFAKAAIGKNLWTIPIGVTINYVPYFSDWHFDANIAYVISEQPLDFNVDYWLANASAGYWFRANLSVNAFLTLKHVRHGISILDPRFIDGDPATAVYPNDWDTEMWWHHDRLVGNRNTNFGLGFDYFFNPEWKVSASAYKSIYTEESNEIDYAFTLGLTRFFGGE